MTMDTVHVGALRLVHDNGRHGISEAAILRSFPVPETNEAQISASMDDLTEAGYVERTIKTRSGGWVYVVTVAGAAALP